MLKRLSHETGQVIVMVAVGMTMLIAISALVIDIGYAYTAQRNLQSSADAAALAGAEGLPNLDTAIAYAEQFGAKGHNSHNNVGAVGESVSTTCVEQDQAPGCAHDAVVVTQTGSPSTFFGKVLGVHLFHLTVKSIACRDPISSKVVLVDQAYKGTACAAPASSGTLGIDSTTDTTPTTTSTGGTGTVVNDEPSGVDHLPLTDATATVDNPPPYTTTVDTTPVIPPPAPPFTTTTVTTTTPAAPPPAPPPTTTTTVTTVPAPPTTTTTATPPTVMNPTITTHLSAAPISVGGSVYDTATLGNVTSDAGGTVTFTVFSNSACTQNPITAGVKTVNHGVVPQSNTLTFNNAGTFYWEARYSGDAHNAPALSPCTSEVLSAFGPCVLGYPDVSNLPASGVDFNESAVLRAFAPTTAGPGDRIKVWYSDEHALTLGIDQVVVKTSKTTSETTATYPLAPLPASPSSVFNPAVGALASQGGIDTSNRPMYPAMFITDITYNPSARNGDWQQTGGNGTPPSAVYGTWKGATQYIDKTRTPATVTVTPDDDPTNNRNWGLGPGADPPPSGTKNENWAAEVVWNVNSLGLQPGHAYRLQVMVHDGDQHSNGGDSGEACMTVVVPA